VSSRRGKRILSAEEADQIRRWIVEQTPDQLGLPFGLWTSRVVRELMRSAWASGLA
jgi:hypothetical protein